MSRTLRITKEDVLMQGGRFVHDKAHVAGGNAWVRRKLDAAGFNPEKPVKIKRFATGECWFEQGDRVTHNVTERQDRDGNWTVDVEKT